MTYNGEKGIDVKRQGLKKGFSLKLNLYLGISAK
jgi:hypothetical protein